MVRKMIFCKAFRHHIRWNQRTSKYANEIGEDAKKWLRRHLNSVRKRALDEALEGLRAGGREPDHICL